MSLPTTPHDKLHHAQNKKEEGDAAFKNGNTTVALRSYHESLMYLHGLDKNALGALGMGPPPSSTTNSAGESSEATKERTPVDELLEKVYANMAACHMKTGNWQRCLDNAEKALAKNENNYKALFRKGKALGEIGWFEKAEAVLLDLKKRNPDDGPVADAEIARLRAIDNEKAKAHRQKLKGFLKGKSTGED